MVLKNYILKLQNVKKIVLPKNLKQNLKKVKLKNFFAVQK